ncbi:MAG TPA: hypothetical protein VG944_16405 [Fimbriimonas sp.]|nr:hypothetical protein [Fimbriimonas sp.]
MVSASVERQGKVKSLQISQRHDSLYRCRLKAFDQPFRGDVKIRLAYKVGGLMQFLFLQGTSLLEWDAIPMNWPTPVNSAMVFVHYDTGALDHAETLPRRTRITFPSRSQLKVQATGPLAKGEGLGLRLSFNPRLVAIEEEDPPIFKPGSLSWLKSLVVNTLALVAVLWILLWTWYTKRARQRMRCR